MAASNTPCLIAARASAPKQPDNVDALGLGAGRTTELDVVGVLGRKVCQVRAGRAAYEDAQPNGLLNMALFTRERGEKSVNNSLT